MEKWKKNCDNDRVFGALLTDLPKAFGCLSHERLSAKPHFNCYGSDKNIFEISTYLLN